MPNLRTQRPVHHERQPSDVWTPGEAAQLDALAAACALIACADGWVTPEEQRGARERMRRLEAVSVFGVDEAMAAFEGFVLRFEHDPADARLAAEAAIRRMRGRRGPSRLLISAACGVADADGSLDAEEREQILRLCTMLDIDPGEFGLIAPVLRL